MNHDKIEKNIGLMGILIILVVSIGGLVEIVPLMFQSQVRDPAPGIEPYDPLELAGRDIYIREGCYNCHSQMIRPSGPRRNATATTRWPASRSTTGRSSGAPSAPGRTSPGSAAATPTSGTAST